MSERIVIMAPHMDDEVLGCGGTVAQLADKRSVHIIYLTDGDSRTTSPSIVDTRVHESRLAAGILGVPEANLIFLNIPAPALHRRIEEVTERLGSWMAKQKISRVFVPFRYDRHPDHLATHRATLRALRQHSIPAEVWEYFVYFKSRLLRQRDVRKYLRPERLVTVGLEESSETKLAALNCFVSQLEIVGGRVRRPVLAKEVIDEFAKGPEVFLVSRDCQSMGDAFASSEAWVALAQYIEPRLKIVKDGALDMLFRLRYR